MHIRYPIDDFVSVVIKSRYPSAFENMSVTQYTYKLYSLKKRNETPSTNGPQTRIVYSVNITAAIVHDDLWALLGTFCRRGRRSVRFGSVRFGRRTTMIATGTTRPAASTTRAEIKSFWFFLCWCLCDRTRRQSVEVRHAADRGADRVHRRTVGFRKRDTPHVGQLDHGYHVRDIRTNTSTPRTGSPPQRSKTEYKTFYFPRARV